MDLRKKIARTVPRLVILLALFTAADVSGQVINQDSLYKAQYDAQMNDLEALNTSLNNKILAMQKDPITETGLKADMLNMQGYNTVLNACINKCNKLLYPVNDIGRARMKNITTWVNADKQCYYNCIEQIKDNNNVFQQQQQNKAVADLVTSLIKLAINYYTGGLLK